MGAIPQFQPSPHLADAQTTLKLNTNNDAALQYKTVKNQQVTHHLIHKKQHNSLLLNYLCKYPCWVVDFFAPAL